MRHHGGLRWVKKKGLTTECKSLLKWWRLPELNRGHTDFQSVALPTELKRQPFIFKDCKFMYSLSAMQIYLLPKTSSILSPSCAAVP